MCVGLPGTVLVLKLRVSHPGNPFPSLPGAEGHPSDMLCVFSQQYLVSTYRVLEAVHTGVF